MHSYHMNHWFGKHNITNSITPGIRWYPNFVEDPTYVILDKMLAWKQVHCVSKKNRTPITFWNNSNKLCLIIIMISWENRQKVLNIVVCYGLTILHKTGYQLRLFRLVEVWSDLRQTVVDDAIDEWRRRLRACVRVKGHHFEHLL